jgi:hypothetical protein
MLINQVAHGFIVGDILRYSSAVSKYAKAQADTLANSAAIGWVKAVNSVDSFTIATSGYYTVGSPSWNAGVVLYLSSLTAGVMTVSPPTAAGTVVRPVFYTETNKTGWFNFGDFGSVNASILQSTIVQRNISAFGHGFVVGDVIRYNSPNYVKAQADTAVNAEAIGIVSVVVDANTVTLAVGGFISGMPNMGTTGPMMFLSSVTAGKLTNVEPTPNGIAVSKPMLIPETSLSGWIVNQRGFIKSA